MPPSPPPGIKQLLPDTSLLAARDGHVFSLMALGNENSFEIVQPASQGSHVDICDTVQKFEGLGENQYYCALFTHV